MHTYSHAHCTNTQTHSWSRCPYTNTPALRNTPIVTQIHSCSHAHYTNKGTHSQTYPSVVHSLTRTHTQIHTRSYGHYTKAHSSTNALTLYTSTCHSSSQNTPTAHAQIHIPVVRALLYTVNTRSFTNTPTQQIHTRSRPQSGCRNTRKGAFIHKHTLLPKGGERHTLEHPLFWATATPPRTCPGIQADFTVNQQDQ